MEETTSDTAGLEPAGSTHRCGSVVLAGPPNSGKSTLLNALLGQKISIVSPRPQTTRTRIRGIVNGDGYQVVLVDTPGMHKARNRLNREMVRIARDTLREADLVLLLLDAGQPAARLRQEKEQWSRILAEVSGPVLLVLNKIDLVAKKKLLPMLDELQRLHPFAAMLPVSARNKEGMESLLASIVHHLPIAPPLYLDDIPTDSPERFLVAEMVREKVFLQTEQEIPYSTAVNVEFFLDGEGGRTTIHATIYVERPSQKGVIIGKNGERLGKIRTAAQRDIDVLLGRRVKLCLWVKVKEDWASDPHFLREQGIC